MKEKGLPIKTIAIEIISVVFAVLFALGVNEWRKNINNEELAEVAVSNILSEIDKNRESLDTTLTNHRHSLEIFKKNINWIKNNEDIRENPEVSFNVITSTSWETAMLTDAVNYMDYELVSELADLYSQQKLYTDLVNKVMEHFIFDEAPDEKNMELYLTRKFYIYLTKLLGIEEQFFDSIKEFQEKHKALIKKYKKSPDE